MEAILCLRIYLFCLGKIIHFLENSTIRVDRAFELSFKDRSNLISFLCYRFRLDFVCGDHVKVEF